MFSGLVRDFGEVSSYQNHILEISSSMSPEIGDSISVNGACLTVIKSSKTSFCVELSSQSVKSIAVENFKGLVHLEPALRMSDGLHGHIVQGHIDFIGKIVDIKKDIRQTSFVIEVSINADNLIISRGSICIDGISLTIAKDNIFNNDRVLHFGLVVIPHTMENTLFGSYLVGRRVNIETDIIARSIEKMLLKIQNKQDKNSLRQDILDSINLSY